jgi:hypothetical protein
MAGLGRKTFNPGDVLNAADVQGYLMDQAVMVFDGTASRGSAIPTPSAGMVAYSTATQLQVYNGSAWVDVSTGYGVATGGASTAITVGGVNYTLLTFTSDSTLTVTKAGLFDVLMFAGGGGGGGGQSAGDTVRSGGGGGAGAIVQSTVYLSANQTITIGAGGAGGPDNSSGTNGSTSKIGALLNIIGGAGGGGVDLINAKSLGCGAGGFGLSGRSAGISILGTTNGFDGGLGADLNAGGGGGGVTANGVAASAGNGGAGGAGFDVSAFIGGSALFKGGGGGGGGQTTGGAGGSGVGGAGSTGAGNSAAANTGSGGGGVRNTNTAGAGGSGILYVRFKV